MNKFTIKPRHCAGFIMSAQHPLLAEGRLLPQLFGVSALEKTERRQRKIGFFDRPESDTERDI
jgi:hypothetical protein